MKPILSGGLGLLTALLFLGCAPTFTSSDGPQFRGHIISSTPDSVRLEPSASDVATLRDLDLIPEGYRGGPIDVPTARITDRDPSTSAIVGLTSAGVAIITTSVSLYGAFEGSGSVELLPFALMPVTGVSAGLAAGFLADWLDQRNGGDPRFRLGVAITGTVLTFAAPLSTLAFLGSDDGFFTYLIFFMPHLTIASATLMGWGWYRDGESEDNVLIEQLTFAPTLITERDGTLRPALGLSLSWR